MEEKNIFFFIEPLTGQHNHARGIIIANTGRVKISTNECPSLSNEMIKVLGSIVSQQNTKLTMPMKKIIGAIIHEFFDDNKFIFVILFIFRLKYLCILHDGFFV